MTALQQQLFDLQDLKYRDFHAKLLPGIDKETIIGIRTPILRKFAKDFAAQEGLIYVDIPRAQTAADGHPTVKGHQYIANQILNALK